MVAKQITGWPVSSGCEVGPLALKRAKVENQAVTYMLKLHYELFICSFAQLAIGMFNLGI